MTVFVNRPTKGVSSAQGQDLGPGAGSLSQAPGDKPRFSMDG